MHRVGEGVDVSGRRLGERLLDRARGGPGDPQVGGERHAVREDRREHAVGDAQPVPLDQPLDREGDGHQEDRDARRQTRDLDQEVGCLAGALVDVLLEPGGGAVRERGDRQQNRDREHAHQEPHQVGRTVHARGEQRFVALDLVDVHLVQVVRTWLDLLFLVFVRLRGRGCAGSSGGGVPVPRLRRGRALCVLVGGVRARQRLRGARSVFWVHALLLHRLFLISYHRSPPA